MWSDREEVLRKSCKTGKKFWWNVQLGLQNFQIEIGISPNYDTSPKDTINYSSDDVVGVDVVTFAILVAVVVVVVVYVVGDQQSSQSCWH